MAPNVSAPALAQARALIRPVARHDTPARTELDRPSQPPQPSQPPAAAQGSATRMGLGDPAEIAHLARRYRSAALSALRPADPGTARR